MRKIVFILLVLYQIGFSYKLKQNEIFANWQFGDKIEAKGKGPFAENIKCEKDDENEEFSASLTLPSGFGTVPVFDEASNVNPSVSEDCMIKHLGGNKFTMNIIDFDICGVTMQKRIDGAIWMSVSIRFPMIGALRTSEDEVITIMCKPQDRIIARNQVLDLKSTLLNNPRTIFSSSPLDFDCNLEVFLKSEDDNSFTRQLPSDGLIEMGEMMQLRASVRPGDGWKYAMLKDVTVHKVMPIISNKKPQTFGSSSQQIDSDRDYLNTATSKKDVLISTSSNIKKFSHHRYGKDVKNREKRQIPDAAFLVLSDGCRNPVFRAIAPEHPFQDSNEDLTVNFNFKAFMFQDMEESGTIRITAKVIACVEQQECQPTQCIDDNESGYGRRKRSVNETQINNYSRELQFNVVLPRYSSATVGSESGTYIKYKDDFVNERKCRHVIYLIGSISLLFCFALTTASSIVVTRSKRII